MNIRGLFLDKFFQLIYWHHGLDKFDITKILDPKGDFVDVGEEFVVVENVTVDLYGFG